MESKYYLISALVCVALAVITGIISGLFFPHVGQYFDINNPAAVLFIVFICIAMMCFIAAIGIFRWWAKVR